MNNQLDQMRRATYVSCVNAQAAQQELLQIQRSAGDSHAATLAVAKQTEADIEAAKAILSINPKMPSPQDDLSIGNIAVHYSLRNDGKSSANSAELKVKAVLLSDKEPLHISTDKFDRSWGIFFGPGDEYPPKPTTPEEKTAPVFTVVLDSAGKAVDRNSPEAKGFFSGTGNEEVFFYGNLDFADFAGRHKWRFCLPVYKIDPEIRRNATKNETECGKYNRVDDRYTAMPTVGSTPETIKTTDPVVCKKPED
jgi:hypothetical protein